MPHLIKKAVRKFPVLRLQVDKWSSFIQVNSVSADGGDQIEVSLHFVLIFSHTNRNIEDEAVAAESLGPAGACDMSQSKRSAARRYEQSQRPRMRMKLADGQ